MQKRASSKYHSGGLWSNTCCGHPRPGENTKEAAQRKLKEEMGIECKLKESFSFIYKTNFKNGLTEYEYNHVLIGNYDREPNLNPSETEEYKWIGKSDLKKDLLENAELYTYWFKICANKVLRFI